MTTEKLEEFLFSQIPISQAMGVRILRADEEMVTLSSPLLPNRNHMGTAFGGSLAAVAILAGYVWVYEALRRRGHRVHIILKSSETEYLEPVDGDFTAHCPNPTREDFDGFLKTFEKKGLARINLQPTIQLGDRVLCRLKGEFVAQKSEVTVPFP